MSFFWNRNVISFNTWIQVYTFCYVSIMAFGVAYLSPICFLLLGCFSSVQEKLFNWYKAESVKELTVYLLENCAVFNYNVSCEMHTVIIYIEI